MVNRRLVLAVLGLAIVGTIGAVPGGPGLGDHEALVAECAREMRTSGDWVVPRFVDTPFIRKPPLPYWLVAATSYLFPNDHATGLPVSAAVARLPSALAGLGTVFLLWKLGSNMFGPRRGIIAALIAGSSTFTLLYSVNATVEMVLTFCCTWAFAHFWFGVNSRSMSGRFVHMMLFYVALGIAMLAKGPAPVVFVVLPLAFWWYTERSQRSLWELRPSCVKRAGALFRRALKKRTVEAFSRLWLFPGTIVFLVLFLPWMLAVARQHPFAWDLWNWQYLQRIEGNYEDTRHRGFFYYFPILMGLLAPWTPAVLVGMFAPWMKRYARDRKALYFAGCWAIIGILAISLFAFKKPYYVLPALPGFVLLVTPVVDAFSRRIMNGATGNVLLATAGAVVLIGIVAAGTRVLGGYSAIRHAELAVPCGIFFAGLVAAVLLCARRNALPALVALGLGLNGAFVAGWNTFGPVVDAGERTARIATLDEELDKAGVPADAAIEFADQRPDARLSFYFRRHPEHLVDPEEVVGQSVERQRGDAWLVDMVIKHAAAVLSKGNPAYLVIDREHLGLLERLPALVRARTRVFITIDPDSTPDGDDWIVLTNTKA